MPNHLSPDHLIFAKPGPYGRRVFTLTPEDLKLGLLILGKPGMGRSDLLGNLCVQQIRSGRGLALLDPYGDLADKLLDHIPSFRLNQLCYFNPADLDYPVSFNPFAKVDPRRKPLLLSGILGVFKALFKESWGPRLEYILTNSISACLDVLGSNLLSLQRLLTDKSYRKRLLKEVEDPVVKAFFESEYELYPERFRLEAIAPIQNKVGRFLTNPVLRNILCQGIGKLRTDTLMGRGEILLANLNRNLIGHEASELLGASLLVQFSNAASTLSKSFTLYIEEINCFPAEALKELLSYAGRSNLNLVLSAPSLSALEDDLQVSLLSSISNIICFKLGHQDAKLIAEQLDEARPDRAFHQLLELQSYQIIFKKYGKTSPDDSYYHSAFTFQLPESPEPSLRQKAIRLSREHYARPKKEVEERLRKHLMRKMPKPRIE